VNTLYYRRESAKRDGEKQAEQDGMTALPIDLEAIASRRDIILDPFDNAEEGVSAMLLRHGNDFGIFYSTAIPNIGFQRFSIAHELGHYFLEGHIDKIPFDEEGIHRSEAGFISPDPYEQEADSFASGLLMPSKLFRRALSRCEDGLDGVKQLASLCQTSLTATAIRYAELTEAASAVIISSGKTVDFAFMSKSMKSLGSLTWLRKGDPLPKNSLTFNFNTRREHFNENEDQRDVDVQLWLGGRRSIEAFEEVIGLGRYGRTLTIVTCPEVLADDDEDESDDELIERWTPRF
jgi:Zn-dependent peptidase ImmA (M78 family)